MRNDGRTLQCTYPQHCRELRRIFSWGDIVYHSCFLGHRTRTWKGAKSGLPCSKSRVYPRIEGEGTRACTAHPQKVAARTALGRSQRRGLRNRAPSATGRARAARHNRCSAEARGPQRTRISEQRGRKMCHSKTGVLSCSREPVRGPAVARFMTRLSAPDICRT